MYVLCRQNLWKGRAAFSQSERIIIILREILVSWFTYHAFNHNVWKYCLVILCNVLFLFSSFFNIWWKKWSSLTIIFGLCPCVSLFLRPWKSSSPMSETWHEKSPRQWSWPAGIIRQDGVLPIFCLCLKHMDMLKSNPSNDPQMNYSHNQKCCALFWKELSLTNCFFQ